MNSNIFNACLLVGWLMALAGGCMLNVAGGLLGAGLLLLALNVFVARVAGIYTPKSDA